MIPLNEDATETGASASSRKTSPPVWFRVISVIALLWFLMDMSAFLMRVLMSDDVIEAMPANQQHLYRDMPRWVNIVFAFEVFGGLLVWSEHLKSLRKKWALLLFGASLLGVLSQTFHIYFLSDAISAMGTPALVMPLLAIMIGLGMIWLAKSAIPRGWLR